MNQQRRCKTDRRGATLARPKPAISILGLFLLVVFLGLTVSSAASQQPSAYWHDVRAIDAADLNLSSIEGVAYVPTTGQFLVFGRLPSGPATSIAVTRVNLAGDVLDSFSTTLPAPALLNATVNPATGELLLADVVAPAGGVLPVRSLTLSAFGVRNPQGMAVDAGNSRLFVLDGNEWVVVPLDAATGAAEGAAQRLAMDIGEAGNLRGIAYNPFNDHLYVGAPDQERIYELTVDGRLVAELDLTDLELSDPRNLVIAPSGDRTDDPEVMSLYVIDRGPAANGRMTELYLIDGREEAAPLTLMLAPAQVRITQTSNWSPPSPDPSGIDYSAKLKRLLVSDGEVEEVAIFRNKNFFLAKTSGVLAKSCNFTGFTTEPVGVAVNPANGAIFISDDNADRVFETRVGPDGKLCTNDDTLTSINTRAFDDFDPEGVAYGQGLLFVTDGDGAEVNVISPGANGVFDGLSPVGDDALSAHFDTARLGIRDPEGIGYHPQRATLFLTSRLERNFLFEVSVSGNLLNTFDISAANPILPAGVGVGPASQDAAKTSIYIVDRGVDNGQDPDENDGRLYEVSLDASSPPSAGPIYLSHAANTSTVFPGLGQTADEDILYFDGNNWSLYFDGSDVGLSGVDLNAFTRMDADTILMSFMQPVTIAGLGKVDDSDILRFDATSLGNNTAGAFSLYFDGSDVGLTNASEDIDALDLLANGRLVISTMGAYSVPGVGGKGDDLLSFVPAGLGATTSGTWTLYFDGSDVGIKPTTNVNGVSVAGSDIFLTVANDFTSAGQPVADEDVVKCTPVSLGSTTVCNFASTLYFDGSGWGAAADDIDAIHIP